MTWSDISFAPPARTLRQFAGLWLLFFAGLAVSRGLRDGLTSPVLGLVALALTVGLLGLWRPALVRPVYVAATVLTFPLGWVMSRLLLAALYYGVFTPLGLLFRLLGRDALRLRPCPQQASYWTAKPAPADVSRYFRQF
jgi:hypothetical protein